MKPETASNIFLGGAIFNWAVGLTLFFIPGIFLNLLAVTPTPEQSLWVQQFAGLIFVILFIMALKALPTWRPGGVI